MPDIVDVATRSRIMSRMTKKWSQIDRKTHNFLKGSKVRHEMYPKLKGSPDILIYPKILVFLDGCFWHCCPKCFRPPKSRIGYWRPKLAGNKRRDVKITRELKSEGWKVIRIWEHEIRAKPNEILRRIRETRSHSLARQSVAPPSSAVGPVSTRRR
jgi:DNA mismatch endonuclease, patch repair protein